jgi:hypothetical protein
MKAVDIIEAVYQTFKGFEDAQDDIIEISFDGDHKSSEILIDFMEDGDLKTLKISSDNVEDFQSMHVIGNKNTAS